MTHTLVEILLFVLWTVLALALFCHLEDEFHD